MHFIHVRLVSDIVQDFVEANTALIIEVAQSSKTFVTQFAGK